MDDFQDEIDSHLDWIKEKMPMKIRCLICDAKWDLQAGPFGVSDDYPGFEEACDILSDWAFDNITPATYESSFCEEHGSEYSEIEGSEEYIRKAIFGKELNPYV